ncbi:MAG TPA: amidohydrolase family protein [Opitutus sp.]|nr:amidohydrolase family protein [Opitutus sp.]
MIGTSGFRAIDGCVLGFLAAGLAAALPAWGAEGAPAPSENPAPPRLTIYTHVTVIDGTGAPAVPDQAIVVEGERIKSVRSMAALAREPIADARRVDLAGDFALPGLIDSHQHLGTRPNRRAAEAQLYRLVYGGVTAVRDMAGDDRFLAELSRSSRLAEIPAPDIYYSALMAGPEFFSDPRTHAAAQSAEAGKVPWLQGITAPTDLVTAVAMARGTGASGIKIYADLPAAEVRRIVAEAHRQGFHVWSHAAIFPARPMDAVGAGVDSISHAQMLVYQFSDLRHATYASRPAMNLEGLNHDTTLLPTLFAAMRSRGTVLDATVNTYFEADRNQPPDKPKRGPVGAQIARAAFRAGVEISAGTDFVPGADYPYPGLLQEMEALVAQVGMTPAEAIHAATQASARALQHEAEMGTIAPGKLANLVFVSHNPLDDLAALHDLVLTVKRGREYRRSDYRQPDKKSLEEDF